MNDWTSLDQRLEEIGQEFAAGQSCTCTSAKSLIPAEHIVSFPYGDLSQHLKAREEAAARRAAGAGNAQLARAKLALPGIVYLMHQEIDAIDEADDDSGDIYASIANLRRLISSIQGLLA